ncbi:hypothetical protein RFI_27229 [Reticulomyxa filosa]|uniref:Uncharacterized protein n=1 Tax=Reticulomyxa filosa TaxID=46433 RepID=X6M839_RETFI|nr:hypothetical protein RFI_27229 [Reticulomyxa filosa]|eukprot:ETO10148.1 hypothetical protein RFI_27229 [Reticulomyxa filosa]
MTNPRIQWMQEVVEYAIPDANESIRQCFEQNLDKITEWLKAGDTGSRIYFYTSPANNTVQFDDTSYDLHFFYIFYKFFKLSVIFNVTKKKEYHEKNSFIVISYKLCDLSKQWLVPIIETCIVEVFEPLISSSEEWGHLRDSSHEKKKFIKKSHQLTELLHTSVVNLETGIDLPLPTPPYDTLDKNSAFEEVTPNKHAKKKKG